MKNFLINSGTIILLSACNGIGGNGQSNGSINVSVTNFNGHVGDSVNIQAQIHQVPSSQIMITFTSSDQTIIPIESSNNTCIIFESTSCQVASKLLRAGDNTLIQATTNSSGYFPGGVYFGMGNVPTLDSLNARN